MSDSTLISAVVCTYNRKYLLKDQFASLYAMAVSHPDEFEVVYVDNNSRDGTFEELTRLCEECANIRVVREERQGLSYARNRGADESRGAYLWYLDDDSLPEPGVLEAYLHALPQFDPEVATGPITPVANFSLPRWLDLNAKQFAAYLASSNFGNETAWIDKAHAWGPNLVLSKAAYGRVGGFNVGLGVIGTKRGGGEEDDIQNRILGGSGRLLYIHDAKVQHVVLPEQTKWRRYLQQRFDRGTSEALEVQLAGKKASSFLATGARIGAHALMSFALVARGKSPAAMDHFGACFGLAGKWIAQRSKT